jgi:tetratricopeptide (TPR) repeat protein
MSTTLRLVETLLERGRSLHEYGQQYDAYRILKQLAGFRELPAAVAEETHSLLAEIQFGRRKYLRARRHLAAALGYCPTNAQYHYLMAAAVDADEEADKQRALKHYRRSLRLDPDQPTCLVDYGLLCVELGRADAGLRALRRAVRLRPDDPEVVGAAVEAMCELDHADEARRLLLAARFRNARDSRFQKLWNDFQFQQPRMAQAAQRGGRRARSGAPILLPFVRPATPRTDAGKRVRRDRPAPLPKPHTPKRIRLYVPSREE